MNGFVKGILIILLIVYIVSPLDLCVGPIDDIIASLLGVCCMAAPKKAKYNEFEN